MFTDCLTGRTLMSRDTKLPTPARQTTKSAEDCSMSLLWQAAWDLSIALLVNARMAPPNHRYIIVTQSAY